MDNLVEDYKAYLKKVQSTQTVIQSLTPFKLAAADWFAAKGYSDRQIAYLLKVSNTTIYQWRKKFK